MSTLTSRLATASAFLIVVMVCVWEFINWLM